MEWRDAVALGALGGVGTLYVVARVLAEQADDSWRRLERDWSAYQRRAVTTARDVLPRLAGVVAAAPVAAGFFVLAIVVLLGRAVHGALRSPASGVGGRSDGRAVPP